jgi:hypothetical protein
MTNKQSKFFDKYPEFLLDDQEEEFNDINALIRGLAFGYFANINPEKFAETFLQFLKMEALLNEDEQQ